MADSRKVENIAMKRMLLVAGLLLSGSLLVVGTPEARGEAAEGGGGSTSLTAQSSEVFRVLANRYTNEIQRDLRTRYILGYPSDSSLFVNYAYDEATPFGRERYIRARETAITAFRLTGIQILNELDIVNRTRKTVAKYTRVEVSVDLDTFEFMGPGTLRETASPPPAAIQSSFAMSGGLPLGIQARFKVAGLEPRMTIYPGSHRLLTASLNKKLSEQMRLELGYRIDRDRQLVTTTLSYAWTRDPQIPFWPAWLSFPR
jgi:hypothetical protein